MSKVSILPKNFSVQDSYITYTVKLLERNPLLKGERKFNLLNGVIYNPDGNVYIDYKTYKKILSLYYIKAGIKLIYGYAVDLLNGLGKLFIVRIERNSNNPRLNKGASFKRRRVLEAEGKLTADNWKIFYVDEDYIRLKWFKVSNILKTLPNLKFYNFVPAGGQPGKGFRQTMSREILTNPALKAVYPFQPYNKKS